MSWTWWSLADPWLCLVWGSGVVLVARPALGPPISSRPLGSTTLPEPWHFVKKDGLGAPAPPNMAWQPWRHWTRT